MNLANIEDNQWRRFIIDWNSTTKTLKIYLVDAVNPILTYTGDIVNTIFSGTHLYIGDLQDQRDIFIIYKISVLLAIWKHRINCPMILSLTMIQGHVGYFKLF